MNIVDVLLIIFILILAVISSGSKIPVLPKKTKEEDDVARLRQMQEWDRFDDTKK